MRAIVETQKLFADLSKTFTDPYAVIRELLQNGKRAGASKINIDYDEHTGELVVRNNGEPISDFQDLIHVSHSGWKPTPEGEKPYGLGFLSVIFSSTEPVEVISSDFTKSTVSRLVIDTEKLIAGEDIGDVVTNESSALVENQVWIGLCVPGLTSAEIKSQVQYFEPGIAVSFKDTEIARPKVLYSVEIPQGELQVYSLWRGVRNSLGGNIPITYQGFITAPQGGAWCNASGFVVKLDQIKFDARLPDRNFILNYTKDVAEELRAQVLEGFRRILKNSVPDAELLACPHFLKEVGMLGLLDNINELPPALCYTPEDIYDFKQGQLLFNSLHSRNPSPKAVLRSDKVIKVDSLYVDDDNRDCFYSALLLGGSVSTHWGNTPPLSKEDRNIPSTLITTKLNWYSDWVGGAFVYRDPEDARQFVFDRNWLYLNVSQMHESSLSEILMVMADYERDGYYKEAEHADDVAKLQHAVEEYLLTETPGGLIDYTKLFKSFLYSNNSLNMPEAMKGKEFTLKVGLDGAVELTQ